MMGNALATALDDGGGRLVPGLIAALVYLAVVALAAMLLLAGAADRWRDDLAGRLSVQLAAAEGENARDRQAADALAAIRAMPEVARAARVPDDRLASLLQPWMAPATGETGAEEAGQALDQAARHAAGQTGGLWPLPVVIDVQLSPAALDHGEEVRARLLAALPGAAVDAGAGASAPALRMMRAMQGLALLLVLVLAAALAAFVVFATRARLAALRETIEITHLLGASDDAVQGVLMHGALRSALIGGAMGFASAALTLLGFGRLAAAGAGPLAELTLSAAAWVALVMLPVAAAAIAAVTARLSARSALSGLP
jgi:cell division transport system permease protein